MSTTATAPVADLFDRSVTVEAPVALDAYGKPVSYATAQTYAARLVMKNVAVRTANGIQVVGRGTVYLDTTDAIDPLSRITLPADFPPTQPPILSVSGVDDDSAASYTRVVVG
jgi:hypothetical protein